MKRKLIALGLSSLLAISLVGTGAAQTSPVSTFNEPIHPAAAPKPALRYRLLPPLDAQTSGNAAPIYYNAALVAPKQTDDERDQINKWTTLPIEQVPRDAVKQVLETYSSALEQLDTAARRDSCAWDPAFREQKFAALLPQLSPLRDAGRVLSLKARLEIADGKFDDAIRDMQAGYAMALHVQKDGALIQTLVGAAIARMFNGVVRDWQAAPNSPNLYWALAELPRPLADIAQPMRREQQFIIQEFPILEDPDHATTEQWKHVIDRWNQLAPVGAKESPEGIEGKLEIVAATAKLLPAARAKLVADGWDQKAVDDMPPQQAVAIYCARDFRRVEDDMTKWLSLPYPIARGGLIDVERELARSTDDKGNPLFAFIPAISRAAMQSAALDREINALQTIEALRAFAAANSGKLPDRLDQLVEMPAFTNPMTGQEFQYQSDGKSATLSDTETSGSQMEYKITLK